MDSCETVSSGASLGNAFHQIVENSLRKGRSNNNSKSSAAKVSFFSILYHWIVFHEFVFLVGGFNYIFYFKLMRIRIAH